MHQNQVGRVFGKHLDNYIKKALKDLKEKRNGIIDEIGRKENVINDAVLTKEEQFKLDFPQEILQYQQEIYEFLHLREQECQEYQLSFNQSKINEKMRNTTVKSYNLKSETLFQTVDLIDQAIQYINPTVEKLELIAITYLFIASKYEEIYPPPIGVLLRGTELRIREFIEIEKEILYKLNFNVIDHFNIKFNQKQYIIILVIIHQFGYNQQENYQDAIKDFWIEQNKDQCDVQRYIQQVFIRTQFEKSTIALTIFLAVEIQFGYQKIQFQWDHLSQHSKPSKDSKPLKLFAYFKKI